MWGRLVKKVALCGEGSSDEKRRRTCSGRKDKSGGNPIFFSYYADFQRIFPQQMSIKYLHCLKNLSVLPKFHAIILFKFTQPNLY